MQYSEDVSLELALRLSAADQRSASSFSMSFKAVWLIRSMARRTASPSRLIAFRLNNLTTFDSCIVSLSRPRREARLLCRTAERRTVLRRLVDVRGGRAHPRIEVSHILTASAVLENIFGHDCSGLVAHLV